MKIGEINTAQKFPGLQTKPFQINGSKGAQTGDVSFGRTIEEHKSWGAVVNPETKEVSFKVLTYPDVKNATVLLTNPSTQKSRKIALENKGEGVFESGKISPDKVKPGDNFQYEITRGNDETVRAKDPYSFCQKQLTGASTVYDHSAFNWKHDGEWKNNPARIKRGDDSIKEARIYAISPDTISDKRSYEGVKSKLKGIKDNGFNAVEIMHIENTFSYNWGYDGVDKCAPSDFLGGPDELKSLVDECHKNGLNVIFDVVPNHIGPDGNQLVEFGPYSNGVNDFGNAVNYEGENSKYVRDWMINAMLNWAGNYHIDGLRLDMTKYMQSDYTLKQLAAEMNYHYPDVFLIAEDSRSGISTDGQGSFWNNPEEPHDMRITSPLLDDEYGKGLSQEEHAAKIDEIANGNTSLARVGMDSEWDFNYFHTLDYMLYDGKADDMMSAIEHSQNSVKYVMSHDEIGNFEGSRKIAKLMVPKLMLNDNITLSGEDITRANEYSKRKNIDLDSALYQITCQKAQLVGEELAIKLQKGEFEQYKIKPETPPAEAKKLNKRLYNEVLAPLGITTEFSYSKIKNVFEKTFEQNKEAYALTFLIPGPKMVFQGDERADLTPFRFFRKFESVPDEDYLYIEKGYPYGEAALEKSTMGKIDYSKEGTLKMQGFEALTQDLNELNENNPAFSRGEIVKEDSVSHSLSRVIGFHTKARNTDNEFFTITNFSELNYRFNKDNEYYIKFPEGRWVEILNTDDPKYSGSGRHSNKEVIESDGKSNSPINLSRYSTCCFKRVG